MSTCIRIKQKSLFKKKLTLDDVIRLTGLSFGVCDETYRLLPGEKADHTLLYDEHHLARGIDISFEGTDIVLLLSLPTSPQEIRTFYRITELICQELKTKTYIREEEQVRTGREDKFILYDEKASIAGLEDLYEKIHQDTYKHFEIFGIYNPISIGLKEIEKIGNDLDSLGEFLHTIQSLDVYYAAPRVYRVKEQLIGLYAIGPDIPSVVPTEPYIVLNQIQGIQAWYVMINEKTIRYEDFISNVSTKEYYDANHVIVMLGEEEAATLAERYYKEI